MDSFRVSEIKEKSKDKTKRYAIKKSCGHEILYASDYSGDGTCKRIFCGDQRGFEIEVYDASQNPVMRIYREAKCCTGWRCCAMCNHCSMLVTVEAPVGQIVGYVKQVPSFFKQQLDILDETGEAVLRLEGFGSSIFGCCRNPDYKIWTADKSAELGVAQHDKNSMHCNI